MKRFTSFSASRTAAAAVLSVSLSSAAFAAGEPFREVWLTDRLSVGLGVGVSYLTDKHRHPHKEEGYTFVGFVNELDDEHAVFPVPEVAWWATRNLRLRLAFDHVEGRTRNYNYDHSDGTVRIRGPVFAAEFVYPTFDDTLFPHAGFGVAWENARFKPERWWTLGWYYEDEWAEAGRPEKKKSGYTRAIKVDDTIGWVLSAGVSWRPVPRLQLDATVRHVWAEPECEYGSVRRKKGYSRELDGKFWLDHATVAVSASYVF